MWEIFCASKSNFQDLQFSFIIDYYAISYVFSFARILTIPWLQFYLLFITQPK